MATEALKSQQITNATAVPPVLNPAYQDGGRVRVKRARVLTVLAAADVGSTYRFFRIKSNDMIKEMILDNGAHGGSAAFNFGLHAVNADGSIGAVVDADFFGSAITTIAAARGVDILRESAVLTMANMEKRVWEALGLTADPQVEYEVVATVTTITAAAADIVLTAEVVGGY
jgi:hypothetical protein